MAGEWLKVDKATPDKPEVMRMARMLRLDRDTVFGKLFRVWAWFDLQSVDGRVDGCVSTDIDTLVDADGFASAMKAVGWLDYNDTSEVLILPNFDRHNGETAKKRALKNRRQSNWRQNKDAGVDAKPSTVASTREEKRREEKKEPPITPKGDKPQSPVGVKAFLDNCAASGELPIPEDDAVFDYAKKTKIPREFLNLCFREFVERNIDSGKRYKDWRKAFRNCVRSNWYKLWYADQASGQMVLTTTGVQAQRKHKEAA